MAFVPNSRVHLLNVPLENDYKNQISFTNRGEQLNYFSSKKVHTFDNLTYVRKDNILKVPMHIDDLYNVNYVMYQNTKYTNRWFYAFITKMDYINDECTFIHIETDVYQTWLTDFTIKPSFVEREHVIDDTPGKHTIPEGLETGEYIVNGNIDRWGFDDALLCITTTASPTTKGDGIDGTTVNGVFSGVAYLIVPTVTDAVNLIKAQAKLAHLDAIQSLFYVPRKILGDISYTESTVDNITFKWARYVLDNVKTDEMEVEIPKTLNGKEPHNKKLLTYPFSYLTVSNSGGGNVVYRYEDFKVPNAQPGVLPDVFKFKMWGAITPGASVKIIPMHYKNIEENYDEGLPLGKYPICNWTGDVFTNWLTQNSLNLALDGVGQVLNLGSAVASKDVGGTISSSLGILQSMASVYQHSLTPPSANGNMNSGDVIFGSKNLDFFFYKMCMKSEYVDAIDSYFDMFGYKVNRVKVPNINTRPHWNYVKTIDINIDGNIPNDDMSKLKAMFNNGVTFWKNPEHVGNYGLDNTI